MGSIAIGLFQNSIEKKNIDINRDAKPNVISVELKDTNIRMIENTNMIPLRISSLDKGSKSTVNSLLLT